MPVLAFPDEGAAVAAPAGSAAAAAAAAAPALRTAGASAVMPANVELDKPFVSSVYRKYRFPELTFAFDRAELSDEGKRLLSMIIDRQRKQGSWFVVRIDGHTDSVGPSDYNERLALERAILVASYLVTNEGMNPAHVFIKGFGENAPIADNNTPEGRQLNRRIEVLILFPQQTGD